ncbi:protein kinase [Pseudonocardia bannensis]|uniref:non-specific serine/threonine protein kinase n=1 Tax=Pseudonocardia bannensis TaxID=630973 RepID=A0A848DG04_9PSEU|nr:protein kinase [Pseudonocardia bannensis]
MKVLAAGQRIADRYQLDHRIAVGGMGEVWQASDTRLGRSVAVKVLRPELSDDPEFLHRFRIEARTVASLDHPGIALVHDYGEDDGPVGGGRTAYLVMELVRGEPLSTRISRGPIEADETLRIVEQAARALQAAHDRGYVHRDVKPGNILIRNDGVVKLTDFGIAKAADAVPVTQSGMVMGTAHYIAPEQASGGEAGPTGDVYSLGIVAYECLVGYRPFRADNAVAIAMMQVRDEPPPLPTSVPAAARELISAVLVKNPDQRYADGGEFAAAVAAVRRGEPLPRPSRVLAAGEATDSTEQRAYRRREEQDERRAQRTIKDARRPGGLRALPRSSTGAATPASGPARTLPASGPTPSPTSGTTRTPTSGGTRKPASSPRTSASGTASTPGSGQTTTPGSGQTTAPGSGEATAPESGATPAPASDPAPSGTSGGTPSSRPASNPTRTPQAAPTPDPLRRSSTPTPARPAAPLTEPLKLQPASGPNRSLLLVLFLLLTLAALLLAIFVVPRLFESDPTPPNPTPTGAPTGTVTGREAILAGPTAVGEPFVSMTVAGEVR